MNDNAIDALRSVSKMKRKDYNKEFKKLKKGDRSEDTIHDARVAARRLNALLEVLSIIRDSVDDNTKLKKKIKKSRKELGGARDIQITRNFLVKNKENIDNFDFDLFEDYYQQVQQKLLKKTDKFIKNFKRKKMNKKLKKIIKNNFKKSNEQFSLNNLFEKIKQEKETLLLEFNQLDRNDKSSFHQLRKDLKKLRYKLEILNETNKYKYNIDNYKNFQDELGEIQDVVVIRETLSEIFQIADNENNLENLNDFLDNEQNIIIAKLMNKKEIFLKMMNRL